MATARHILVVEDDRAIRLGVVDSLELAGYIVTAAATHADGLAKALGVDCDLVLLDLALPGGDGLTILAEIRRRRAGMPVILLTARGGESDRVRGLTGGADDYVVKPFGMAELLARVEAVLRRAGAKAAPIGGVLRFAGGTADLARREIRRDGPAGELSELTALTEQEAALLRLLAERRDRAVPRDELAALLNGSGGTRAVDMAVLRLRQKLGDTAEDPQVVRTVRGCGYQLGAAVEVAP